MTGTKNKKVNKKKDRWDGRRREVDKIEIIWTTISYLLPSHRDLSLYIFSLPYRTTTEYLSKWMILQYIETLFCAGWSEVFWFNLQSSASACSHLAGCYRSTACIHQFFLPSKFNWFLVFHHFGNLSNFYYSNNMSSFFRENTLTLHTANSCYIDCEKFKNE